MDYFHEISFVAIVGIVAFNIYKNLKNTVKKGPDWLFPLDKKASGRRISAVNVYGKPKSITGFRPFEDFTEEITLYIRERDPRFSKVRFLEWVKDFFVLFQKAWEAGDGEKLRPFETENLFHKHKRILNKEGESRFYEMDLRGILFGKAHLFLYNRTRKEEFLTVYIEGYRSHEKGKIPFLFVFNRPHGSKTVLKMSDMRVIACPHCGGPTPTEDAVRCGYCGFLIVNLPQTWHLSGMIVVNPRLTYGRGGVILNDKREA